MQELDKGVVIEKTHVHKIVAGFAFPKVLGKTRQQTRKTQMLQIVSQYQQPRFKDCYINLLYTNNNYQSIYILDQTK